MKRLVLQLMQRCGMFALARAQSAAKPRILVYHNFCADEKPSEDSVNVASLRRQLHYLRRHFQVVKLSELCTQLASGHPDHKLVALTVDDGRRNFYECLFPLLEELQIPATFFVVTSFIDKKDWLWTDKVLWLSQRPQPPEELGRQKIRGFFAMLNQMRPEARNACIESFAAGMGVCIPEQAPTRYAPCSWAELREMCESGLVEIGSHTVTHPILASLDDTESVHEIAASRAEIEAKLRAPIKLFGIPNGTSRDYRPSQLKQIQAAGYASAVVAQGGLVGLEVDPYQLPRIGMAGWIDDVRFAARVDGVEHYRSGLRMAMRHACSVFTPRDGWEGDKVYAQTEHAMTGSSD